MEDKLKLKQPSEKSSGFKLNHLKLMGLALAVSAMSVSVELNANQNDQKLVGLTIKNHLETYHLRKQKVDDALSQKAFKEYVKRLDYGKQFLLKDDVAKLEKYQFKMDDQMVDGDLKLVRESKAILEERIALAEKLRDEFFKKEFNFDEDETLQLDPEKRDFAKDQAALKEQWRKIFKHTTLTSYIALLENDEEGDKAKGDGVQTEGSAKKTEADKNKAKKEAPAPKLSKQEMMKKAHATASKKYKRVFERLKKDGYEDFVEKFMNSIATIYDPHTSYMPPKRKEDFDIDISGSLEGIGAVLQEEDGYIKVVSIVPGGAAWRQKDLEKGDTIMSVSQDDEEEAVDLYDMKVEDAVRYIRGKKGTKVFLTVKKTDGTHKRVGIMRDKVVVSESFAKSSVLEHQDLPNLKIGYIQVPKFYRDFGDGSRNVTEDVKDEIDRLKKQKIGALILDLRNNGGGALEDARQITGLFINKGPVVQTKNHLEQIDIMKDEDEKIAYDGPLVVLVNRFSASASEILAGALQDYKRAVIVGGENTHGKGTVQVVLNLNHGSLLGRFAPDLGSLKLTIQKFYRINGVSTQYKGITPDIIIPDAFDYTESREQDLEYSLPFDSVQAAKYSVWDKFGYHMPQLISHSQERIKKDKKLQKIQGMVTYLKQRQDETLVSLNMNKTREEEHEHRQKMNELKVEDPDLKLKVNHYEASLKSHENIQPGDEKRWKEDFELRKAEWVKSLRLDPGLEEGMFIAYDAIQMNKATSSTTDKAKQ